LVGTSLPTPGGGRRIPATPAGPSTRRESDDRARSERRGERGKAEPLVDERGNRDVRQEETPDGAGRRDRRSHAAESASRRSRRLSSPSR
jgi:hypothetical protein